jgi:regulator of sigma E protease
MITSIIAAVVIFSVLIIIHEAGHFFVAKRMGVRVLRFSLGYPPRVWGIRRGETDYAIGATPLGGYVRMLGDEVAAEPSVETLKSYLEEIRLDLLEALKRSGWLARSGKVGDDALAAIATDAAASAESKPGEGIEAILGRPAKIDEAELLREIARAGTVPLAIERLAENHPSALVQAFNVRAFPTQPLRRRFAIVLAGPAANILFAPLLTIIVFMVGVSVTLPVLGTVDKDMPGYAAGLRAGDRVVAVDGHAIDTWDDFSRAVKGSGGHALSLAVARGHPAARLAFAVTPSLQNTVTIYGDKAPTWIIGVKPSGAEETRRFGPIDAISYGTAETGRMVVMLVVGIAKIIEGATPMRQALGGPIMIAQIAGREVHQGFADLAMFMVSISLELGIINLLPVPLLDGGHLLFFVIEGIRGEPLKLRHREIAMQVGLFLLVILMAFVILNDLSRLIG